MLRFAITRASPLVELTDIVWMHNGTRLNITLLELQGRYNFSDDLQMLTISDVQVSDEGEFSLGASNPAGFDSATTNLTVYGKLFGFLKYPIALPLLVLLLLLQLIRKSSLWEGV